MTRLPIKLVVDDGRHPRYDRYGYVRDISDRTIVLDTPGAERFATASIPLVSVVDMEDTTAEVVERNPRGALGRRWSR